MNIFFATYTQIYNYSNGIVNTRKKDLQIVVQKGELKYSSATMLVFSPDIRTKIVATDMMVSEAEEAQRHLATVPKGDNLLVIVYSGLSAFSVSIKMINEIKRDNPNARIIATTCNCDLRIKKDSLNPLIEQKIIEAVVHFSECGGKNAMGEILQKFVEIFPNEKN
jgi:hypothetical protein